MALKLNNAVTEFDTLFECVVELHKFGARNLDNMRGGENIEDPDFLASVSLCRLNVQEACLHMLNANLVAAKTRKRKLLSGEGGLSKRFGSERSGGESGSDQSAVLGLSDGVASALAAGPVAPETQGASGNVTSAVLVHAPDTLIDLCESQVQEPLKVAWEVCACGMHAASGPVAAVLPRWWLTCGDLLF